MCTQKLSKYLFVICLAVPLIAVPCTLHLWLSSMEGMEVHSPPILSFLNIGGLVCELQFLVLVPASLYILQKHAPGLVWRKTLKFSNKTWMLVTAIVLKFSTYLYFGVVESYNIEARIAFLFTFCVLEVIYMAVFGKVLGSATSTFSAQCQCIEDNFDIDKAGEALLTQYQALKNGCQLGFLAVIACFTPLIVLKAYYLIITQTSDCLGSEYFNGMSCLFVLQVISEGFYMFYYVLIADDCYMNFLDIADHLR